MPPGAGVIVVGASSPVGRAIARAFGARGDRVFGVGLEPSADPVLAGEVAVDCSTEAGAQQALDAARTELGSVRTLIAAAGRMPVAKLHATSDEEWRGALAATLDTVFHCARAWLRDAPRDGTLVCVSSVNASLAAPGVAAYAAAKGAVEALVRQLALDYSGRGIRVNAVAPGLIAEHDDRGELAAGYPLGHVVHPDDVAAAVVFLASDEARSITGAVLPVDAGLGIASPAAFLRADLRARLAPDWERDG